MKTHTLEQYLNDMLNVEGFMASDASMNGLQVDSGKNKDITRIGYAVDASLETFEQAARFSCDAMIVHHGLFWGKSQQIIGTHYRRIATLLTHDISLFAYHLPLDAHDRFGNNAVMARLLGLQQVVPFGEYHGVNIGVMGVHPEGLTLEQVSGLLGFHPDTGLHILPFGKERVKTVAIISGGAPSEVEQAVRLGADLYVTGETSHTMYGFCKEEGINMISGGHYQSEVFGVSALAEHLSEKFSLTCTFIDVPTGL
ncbi:MAG: Nif3-like dinuclear metal center hexameric protein [Sphaerochaetaceae bacterium]|nr:Nif3-like dinuclear metal center hexameric protein [Sphaerochaetaceae bacterium]